MLLFVANNMSDIIRILVAPLPQSESSIWGTFHVRLILDPLANIYWLIHLQSESYSRHRTLLKWSGISWIPII